MGLHNGKQGLSGFFGEFREFISKGNVTDLAIAVIIGGAFGKVVTSLIEDIITPLILNPALAAAKVDDLAKLQINGIKYGLFLAAVINFVVIAFVIFIIIRTFASMKRKEKRQEAIAEVQPNPQERLTLAVERLAEVMESKQ